MTEATFTLGGEVTIPRMGFGAMRLTGDGVWHWPKDRETAKGVLRSALDHGIRLIDTADAYGPETNEYLIAEVLKDHRPDGVIVATKGGLVRGGPSDWRRDGRPDHLKRAVKNSLRRLEVERIDLYQLHAIDPEVPLEDSLGAIRELQDEGLIRFVGVSNFGIVELKRARQIVDVISVQNRYNLGDRNQEPVLEVCQREGIAFIPWYPLAVGELADEPVLQEIAADKGATPLQIALSWLLHRSSVMLPIPGTSSADHLAENWAARKIELTSDDLQKLDTICPVTPAR